MNDLVWLSGSPLRKKMRRTKGGEPNSKDLVAHDRQKSVAAIGEKLLAAIRSGAVRGTPAPMGRAWYEMV